MNTIDKEELNRAIKECKEAVDRGQVPCSLFVATMYSIKTARYMQKRGILKKILNREI